MAYYVNAPPQGFPAQSQGFPSYPGTVSYSTPVRTIPGTTPMNGWGMQYTSRPSDPETPEQAPGAQEPGQHPNEKGVYTVQTEESNEALGISFERFENGPPGQFSFGIHVDEVEEDSWAERAGIEAGDTILTVNGNDVSDMIPEGLQIELQNNRPSTLVLQKSGFSKDDDDWTLVGERQDQGYEHGPEDHFTRHVHKWYPDIDLPDKDDVHAALLYLPSGAMNHFPCSFLFFCIAIYIVPIYLVLYVGEDSTSRQFLPRVTPWVLTLPLLYIIAYFAHVWKGGPSKFWIVLSLVGSGTVLLVIADVLLVDSYEKGPVFSSASDCGSWGEKRRLQEEWNVAATFYAKCMNKTAGDASKYPEYEPAPGVPWSWAGWQKHQDDNFAAAATTWRIQDCPGYDTWVDTHPDWNYLEHLEVYQQCGGWCTFAPPLWAKGVAADPCSVAVAHLLADKIGWALKQVIFYTIFAVLATSLLLLGVPPILKKYGIEW